MSEDSEAKRMKIKPIEREERVPGRLDND
jgi:hypothetical protein